MVYPSLFLNSSLYKSAYSSKCPILSPKKQQQLLTEHIFLNIFSIFIFILNFKFCKFCLFHCISFNDGTFAYAKRVSYFPQVTHTQLSNRVHGAGRPGSESWPAVRGGRPPAVPHTRAEATAADSSLQTDKDLRR